MYLNDNDQSWLDILARDLPEESAPTVSVVIPTYNHGNYVGQAVESVLGQDWRDFEVIVVDDGSTDHTRSVVEKYGKPVRYYWQENQGLSAARNTGIRLSEGLYIGLLDADDLYERDFLSTMVEFMEQNGHFAAVYCGYRFVTDDNHPLPQVITRHTDPEDFFHTISKGNFLVPEGILVRRECYQQVGEFDESLSACEDWDMWLRISKSHQVAGIPIPLTRHRVLPGSMSSVPKRMLSNRLAVLEKNFGPLPTNMAEASDHLREIYSRAYLAAVIEYLQTGDRTKANAHFQDMARIWPKLLLDTTTYYELGCGGQGKGYRGDKRSLSLEDNALFIFSALQSGRERYETSAFWDQAIAAANFGLGMLSYNTGNHKHSRKFLRKAIAAHSRYRYDRTLISTLMKSILGPTIVKGLKSLL